MLRKLLIPIIFGLAGCNSSSLPFDGPTRGAVISVPNQAPAIRVPATGGSNVQQSNAALVSDFMALSFALESGATLQRFTRFEGPISVSLTGPASQTSRADLNALLARLRNEAGITIFQTNTSPANINIQMVARSDIQSLIPSAACFVAPNVQNLQDYAAKSRSPQTRWSNLTERRVMSIFVPADSSPKEIRDCLHEELAQALGPVNDLYSLPNSIFNDDNIHSTLTDFDMLMLRVYYDGTLHNGMSPSQVASLLPAIFDRVNPAGKSAYGAAPAGISPRWNAAINTALGAGVSTQDRIRAAEQAVVLATTERFQDVRLGFSYFVLGRTTMPVDAAKSKLAFLNADRAYAQLPNTQLHRAYVASFLAAFTLAEGDSVSTLNLVRPYKGVAQAHENQALLSTLMLIEAEALDLAGNGAAARSVRLDTLDVARYGFGSDQAIAARLREISALNRG